MILFLFIKTVYSLENPINRGEDGFSILKKLRNTPSLRRLPIIMVTAKSSALDTVRGLDCGAADYITKPFGIMEFLSRVRACLLYTSRCV